MPEGQLVANQTTNVVYDPGVVASSSERVEVTNLAEGGAVDEIWCSFGTDGPDPADRTADGVYVVPPGSSRDIPAAYGKTRVVRLRSQGTPRFFVEEIS